MCGLCMGEISVMGDGCVGRTVLCSARCQNDARVGETERAPDTSVHSARPSLLRLGFRFGFRLAGNLGQANKWRVLLRSSHSSASGQVQPKQREPLVIQLEMGR
jgi:hypothetical protein